MSGGYTLSETREIIKRFGIKPSKGLGQNFLTDKNILGKMVTAAELNQNDQVLEIGPGIGTLTRELAAKVGEVVAVEIDKRLVPVLGHTLKYCANVEVINADILTFDLKSLWKDHFTGRVKVVANLPYYVTSPIIMRLLEENIPLERIVVMVQKEVAQRMNAGPGGKDYGALSIAVQYRSRPSIVAEIPPTVFVPPPKVASAIIRLDIKDADLRCAVKDERLLFRLVRAAFGQRRKTLINALGSGLSSIAKEDLAEALEGCGIDRRRRGETLSIEEFCRLADYIYEKIM
ncbi:MAG: 16S rRNA (adenine(1518)-N(6)/adenine(1519)-N(6))-dimethyltransferase RsmA [Bacillota bacterium]|nr:16S rRNA (adenine(1518)-N(6)/adenine(1519)-N(6))-dimethyltransferase RsmA [Bacillota bacterium]MDD3297432.1 16S rRNA (adenine(1518)-N(6)/adenine(1519)-N(6))-dimethyltransferase RsmA [Bacillota bacterium]MDD3850244.1 16S rRNA (adenine(1518)-N(6)/adenine(1519)-N(6))-dimethyltransferase RsmA [Bacillota bacterium]MDD4707201.1 16S rRNA (adenine(1518)-N(6)/adenine(1519)-N(6))-dimethyltransferase RsmA [Bacillota bacterium]